MSKNTPYSVESLAGQTLIASPTIKVDAEDQDIEIRTDAGRYRMYHARWCCEYVRVVAVRGNPPAGRIVSFVESDAKPDWCTVDGGGSHTWTVYRIESESGVFEIVWLGESNGYYSESVSFDKIED